MDNQIHTKFFRFYYGIPVTVLLIAQSGDNMFCTQFMGLLSSNEVDFIDPSQT